MQVTINSSLSTKTSCHFIRTQVVGDFTAARVNDSAWADGTLVLEETVLNSLEKQAQDLVNAIK